MSSFVVLIDKVFGFAKVGEETFMQMTDRRFRIEMDAVIEDVDYYMMDKKGDRESLVRHTAIALSDRGLIPYDKYEVLDGDAEPATSIEVLEEDPTIKAVLVLIEASRALHPLRDLCWNAYKMNCPSDTGYGHGV
ncbi:MAG: hypothetical protein EXS47_02020 [Candidatus Zambryskibacteria bacterium]|nr:hypothetical protein [Candidatus Zambryskibacteria bacterium]